MGKSQRASSINSLTHSKHNFLVWVLSFKMFSIKSPITRSVVWTTCWAERGEKKKMNNNKEINPTLSSCLWPSTWSCLLVAKWSNVLSCLKDTVMSLRNLVKCFCRSSHLCSSKPGQCRSSTLANALTNSLHERRDCENLDLILNQTLTFYPHHSGSRFGYCCKDR